MLVNVFSCTHRHVIIQKAVPAVNALIMHGIQCSWFARARTLCNCSLLRVNLVRNLVDVVFFSLLSDKHSGSCSRATKFSRITRKCHACEGSWHAKCRTEFTHLRAPTNKVRSTNLAGIPNMPRRRNLVNQSPIQECGPQNRFFCNVPYPQTMNARGGPHTRIHKLAGHGPTFFSPRKYLRTKSIQEDRQNRR